MSERGVLDHDQELDRFIARFESDHARGLRPNLSDYLPDEQHPLYADVLRELIRVDLEYAWTSGQRKRVDDYADAFPQFFQDRENLGVIAYEEYRLRRQHGDDATIEEYRRRFALDAANWPGRSTRLLESSAAAEGLPTEQDALDASPSSGSWVQTGEMPEVGDRFLGFRLVTELGRGAFGTVYLAHQGDLAHRPVALKISRELVDEPQTLAQLQHTNIVPVYSVHRAGDLQAVCMPFFGSTTLADFLEQCKANGSLPLSGKELASTLAERRDVTQRADAFDQFLRIVQADLEHQDRPHTHRRSAGADARPIICLETLAGLSYVEAVLWIGARLADGLAHAHERGILHCDLKPANILLADDGQPMLLDFNLSQDLKRKSTKGMVGGTLPYMAPEHLVSLRDGCGAAEVRSDLYALGVILYEMLTGSLPFPVRQGNLEAVLSAMVQDRLVRPALLPIVNPGVTPAVAAIVHRCLEPDPQQRYLSASELREDLQRQLASLPLLHAREPSMRERATKWVRRHPKLTSATSVVLLAGALLAALAATLAIRSERLAQMEAGQTYQGFQSDLREAQVLCLDAATRGEDLAPEVVARCRRALDRFHVLDDPQWRQTPDVRRLSAADQQQLAFDAGEALFLLAALTRPDDDSLSDPKRDAQLNSALDFNRRAQSCYEADELPFSLRYQQEILAAQLARRPAAQALPARPALTPKSVRDRCLLACFWSIQRRFRDALPLWQEAARQDPRNVWAWYGLASCYEQLSRPSHAAACYTACIALKPDYGDWYFHRGLAYLKQREFNLASGDFDMAIQRQADRQELRINRALARIGENRCDDAIADLQIAERLGGDRARIYLAMAQAREKQGDIAGARGDRQRGLECEPSDDISWVTRGVTRVDDEPAEAIAAFDRALQLNPHCLAALENKAHVLAEKLARIAEAVLVLDRAAVLYPERASTFAARGVLLARLGQQEPARADAQRALALGASDAIRYQVSGIYALLAAENSDDRSRAIALLASALRHGYGAGQIGTDVDLEALRDEPEFQKLLQAAQALQTMALE